MSAERAGRPQDTGRPPEPVRAYLAELDAALAERKVPDRQDIVASIREHIDSSLGPGPVDDERVHGVLTALGDPLAIAADAAEHEPPTAGRRGPLTASWVPALTIALILVSSLTLLFYLPVVTLLVGLVLLWISALWTPGEKLLGTFLLPAPGIAVIVAGGVAFSGVMCTSQSGPVPVGSGAPAEVEEVCTGGATLVENVISVGAVAVVVVASIVTAVMLYRRGTARSS